MPRKAATSIENSFRNGLVTEASGLNFPESACTDTDNCVFDIDGTVTRRLGFQLEANSSWKSVSTADKVVQTYEWKNVAGDGNLFLVVVQIGATLYFYDASTTDAVSAHALGTTVDLNTFKAPSAPDINGTECQFADGNGLLFVVHPYLNEFRVSYDPSTSTVTATAIGIKIRDLEGLEDSLAVDQRPATGYLGLSKEHHYNLLNQGWNATNLQAWDAGKNDMPSNCDVMWVFKNSSENFDVTLADKIYRGNSAAPKGHYVLSLFNQDRTGASGILFPNTFNTGYHRCSSVAFFAGRVFYSGLSYEGYNAKIFFTQIIEREDQYAYCYQANDPTSEDAFDLLPSDGGVIVIHEAGTIIKMVPVTSGLLIFATKGVWLISGSTGIGFTATDYTVSKISDVAALTASSFVVFSGSVAWWNLEGIYTITGSQQGPTVTSLTETRIKDFYLTIPPSSKRRATGVYNPISGIIQWLFRDTEAASITEFYAITNILNFNVNTAAFYPWSVSGDVTIHGAVVVENLGGTVSTELVTDSLGNVVTDSFGDDVYVFTIGSSIVIPKFKYLVSYSGLVSFSEERSTSFVDWSDVAQTDYDSFFITGYKVHGEGNKDFQSNYVTIMSGSSPTAYFFQGLWDYANTGNSGKWSSKQHVTHYDTNFDYATRRLKVRGSGKALQFKVTSQTGQPFNITGWSVFETGDMLP